MAIRIFDQIDQTLPRPLPEGIHKRPDAVAKSGIPQIAGPADPIPEAINPNHLARIAVEDTVSQNTSVSMNRVVSEASQAAEKAVRNAMEALKQAIESLEKANSREIVLDNAFKRPLSRLKGFVEDRGKAVFTNQALPHSESFNEIVQLTREKIFPYPALAKNGQANLQADELLKLTV